MSLRGIDAQIMVNKSVEVASEQMKNARLHDVNQNHSAHQVKQLAEEEQARSQAISRTENLAIKDGEEREPEEGREQKKRQASETGTQETNDLMLPVGRRDEHLIDIQI